MSNQASGEWGRQQGGPWWRFTPRSRAVGILGVIAGVLLLVQGVIVLVDRPSGVRIALEAVICLLAVANIVRSIDGLRRLRDRR